MNFSSVLLNVGFLPAIIMALKIQTSLLSFQLSIVESSHNILRFLIKIDKDRSNCHSISESLQCSSVPLGQEFRDSWSNLSLPELRRQNSYFPSGCLTNEYLDFSVNEIDQAGLDWLSRIKEIPSGYFVSKRKLHQLTADALVSNTRLLENSEFFIGYGLLIDYCEKHWLAMRNFANVWLLMDGESMVNSQKSILIILKSGSDNYSRTSKDLLREGDAQIWNEDDFRLSIVKLHRLIASFLYIGKELKCPNHQSKLASVHTALKDQIRLSLILIAERDFILADGDVDKDFIMKTMNYGYFMANGLESMQNDKVIDYINVYWTFLMSQNLGKSVIMQTAIMDFLAQLALTQRENELTQKWTELSAKLETTKFPNRLLLSLLLSVLSSSFDNRKDMASSIFSRIDWPTEERFKILISSPKNFGLFDGLTDDSCLRRALRYTLIKNFTTLEMRFIRVRLGLRQGKITRSILVKNLISLVKNNFFVSEVLEKPVILPRIEIHPHIEEFFWSLIKMACIMRLRLPFIIHQSYISAIFFKDSDHLNLVQLIINKQFHESENLTARRKSVHNLSTLYFITLVSGEKFSTSLKSYQAYKKAKSVGTAGAPQSSPSFALESMGCFIWNARPFPIVEAIPLAHMTPELYQRLLFY